MKRKASNIYDKYITIDNLKETWEEVKKSCDNKNGLYKFMLNENVNLYNIYINLKYRTYKPYRYNLFYILRPKARLIMSQIISDRIVNHFVAKHYLFPYLEKKLIDSSVAIRSGKGCSYAFKKLEDYLNGLLFKNRDTKIYALKMDIKNFFYSIDHEILYEMLEHDLGDKDVINLIKMLVDETDKKYINEFITRKNKRYHTEVPYYNKGVGLSIGSMVSQFLATYYLNQVDHYIKEELKCKFYLRYMDDFLILDTDKARLKEVWKAVEEKLAIFKLKLNSKTNIYNMKNGVTFLGYRYKVRNNKLRRLYGKPTFKRIRRHLKYLKNNDMEMYYHYYTSYYGYLSRVKKWERDFKMRTKDRYLILKKRYPNSIVLIKDGNFYKTYQDDATIIWNLFGYKWNEDCISFGSTPYAKVINKLNYINISYVVVANNKEMAIANNEETYELYLKISKISYDTKRKRESLHKLIDSILDKNINNYDDLNMLLNKYIKFKEKNEN